MSSGVLPAPINFSEILTPTVQYELYNAADVAIEGECGGEVYRVPANHEFHQIRNEATGQIVGQYPKPGVLPITSNGRLSAIAIIRHLVGEDGRSGKIGIMGIRALFQDPEKDKLVKREAMETWVEKRRSDALARTRAHEQAVARAQEAKLDIPRPNRQVQADYLFLREADAAEALKYQCGVCGWGFAEEREKDIHVVTFHRGSPRAAKSAERLGIAESDADFELESEPKQSKPLPNTLKSIRNIMEQEGVDMSAPDPETDKYTAGGEKKP